MKKKFEKCDLLLVKKGNDPIGGFVITYTNKEAGQIPHRLLLQSCFVFLLEVF